MRAREENEKRMIELSAQLDEARKAQREHDFAQQKVRENKAKANLRHQEEVIHKLKTQIKFFISDFPRCKRQKHSPSVIQCFQQNMLNTQSNFLNAVHNSHLCKTNDHISHW